MTDEVPWQQVEDKAMEEETILAMKLCLINHLGPFVNETPTDVGTRWKIQEWDVYPSGNRYGVDIPPKEFVSER